MTDEIKLALEELAAKLTKSMKEERMTFDQAQAKRRAIELEEVRVRS